MTTRSPDELQLRQRVETLYAARADECVGQLTAAIESATPGITPRTERIGWDQQDVVLITYGDQIRDEQQPPLGALREFLVGRGFAQLINTVHILPFTPYSSDDGFSVIDYRRVDPNLGTWEHIAQLGSRFELMFDLVLNHISRQSRWFQDYLQGVSPYERFFIEADADADVSQVTRPRSLPLLTPVDTSRGQRHVWTTFSDDQIDLNYDEPEVLVEMVSVLLDYVAKGARIIRLDAVAYLWKELGTNCIHLPQTHEVVKLFRQILQAVAPHVWLITETNVPHDENISYFGNGDEAHMVYQFSLPPLLLDAFISHDATAVMRWLGGLGNPPPGATYFNFTASHDGVGVRPLEGLVSTARRNALADWVKQRGGRISTRRNPDGSDAPYELNVSYVDALGVPSGNVEIQTRRFLASQAIMLSLRGVPGVYFHSLVGTQNDVAAVEASGQPRRINRRKFRRDELDHALAQPGTLQQQIFQGYQELLKVRISQPAFHPDASQRPVESDDARVIAFARESLDGRQTILVLSNVCNHTIDLDAGKFVGSSQGRDLLSGRALDGRGRFRLDPYQVGWIAELKE